MANAPVGEIRHTFCRICEALCGLEVTLEQGRVREIRPDAEHVATRGFGCVKGLKQHKLLDSPDRLRYPLKKTGDRHERISWDQALAEIGAKAREIMARLSPDAIAMYVGTAAGFGVLHPVFAQGFMTGLGSKSMYASATQDCANKFAVARHVYGFPFTQPFPDLDHVGALFIIGANPVVSKWSFLQVSNPGQRLKEIEARGGRVVVIDPRRTETAKVAAAWVPIRPGTDVFFFLSFLHELVASGGVDRERAALHMKGVEEVEKLVSAWPPERTEAVTRIPAAKLRELVAPYREADGAAFYCSTGVNMGGHGSLAFWLQECVNALSGNLDRRGGTLVGRGVIDFAKFGVKNGLLVRDDRSRIGAFGSVNDAFPGGVLADEILTPGVRQVRSLFVTGGNPLITMPNAEPAAARVPGARAARRARRAADRDGVARALRAAVYVAAPAPGSALRLPAAARPPDAALSPGDASRRAAGRRAARRGDHLPRPGPRLRQAALRLARRAARARAREGAALAPPPGRAAGGSAGGAALAAAARDRAGRLPGAARPRARPAASRARRRGFPRRASSPRRTARCSSRRGPLLDAARGLDAAFEAERASAGRLKLITKRHVKTHNSWTHNHEEFVTGEGGTNYLYLHPDDAARIGLADGELADVTSATATLRVPIRRCRTSCPAPSRCRTAGATRWRRASRSRAGRAAST